MHRSFLLLLLPFASFLFAACTAKVDEKCVSGNCDIGGLPDAFKPPPVDADAGGLVVCSAPAGPPTGDIPCDVFEVMHRRCHGCHIDPPAGGAPFPILSYEDTQKPFGSAQKIFQRMNEVIRPGGIPRMPFDGPLNDQDQQILNDWLNQCAPPTADGMGCECPAPGMGCN